MRLQKTVLSEFKRNYPNLTYHEISKLTGIQQTRAFRILNGSELKISEYEIFEKLNKQKAIESDSQKNFKIISEKAMSLFPDKKLKILFLKIQREIQSELLRSSTFESYSSFERMA